MGMTSRLKRLLLCCVLVGMAIVSLAQDTRTVDGRTYMVHRVEAGQTLFAISRAYAVPVDALLAANPAAMDGLSIGEEVLVPQDAVVKKDARTAPVLVADGELRHTVQKKETVYGIARRYGVDINALMDRNPGIVDGLREGMEVVVPMATVTGQPDGIAWSGPPHDVSDELDGHSPHLHYTASPAGGPRALSRMARTATPTAPGTGHGVNLR